MEDVFLVLNNPEIPKQAFIVIGISIAVTALLIAGYLLKRRKRDREKEQHAIRRMREEVLDRALENPMGEVRPEPFEKARRPFLVEYSKGDEAPDMKGGMYQLTEMTELSQRRYMFRCQETVRIGNQFGTVMILPGDASGDQVFCQIFFYGRSNYLRSTGAEEVLLKRKGNTAIVNKNGLKLRSGDCFTVGKTSFVIEFL